MNTMERLTWTTLTSPFIHLWVKDLSIPCGHTAALSSSPLRDPSLSSLPSFISHSHIQASLCGRARHDCPSNTFLKSVANAFSV